MADNKAEQLHELEASLRQRKLGPRAPISGSVSSRPRWVPEDRAGWLKWQRMLAKRYDPLKLLADMTGKVYRMECEDCGQPIYSEWPNLKRCWDCRQEHSREAVRQFRQRNGLVAEHKKRRCECCRQWFQPVRSTARFCTTVCRVKANRQAKRTEGKG